MYLKPLPHFAFLAALLLALGCGRPSPEVGRTVTDDLGRTVTLPDTLRRIVPLAPNLTELLFAAGGGDRIAAVTTADTYPPAIDSLPHFSALPMDFEALAALEPDLVLATDQVNNPEDAETLAALDIPVYFFSYRDLSGMLSSLRQLGSLLGTSFAAERRAAELEARLASVEQRTAEVENPPLTLLLIGDETLFAFGDESYVHDLIARAGGRSATADIGTEAPVLSDEFVLKAQPDIIIGTYGADYDVSRLLDLHPTWDVVPAVQQERIYTIDPDLILRPGPRLVDGVERLAQLLHPELFAPASGPAP